MDIEYVPFERVLEEATLSSFRSMLRTGGPYLVVALIDDVALVPLRIDDVRVSRLEDAEREWFIERVRRLCAELGTEVVSAGRRITARAATGALSH